MSAPISPTLYDACPAYREALDNYLAVSATWPANPSLTTAWAMDRAWQRVTNAASEFRRLKAVE